MTPPRNAKITPTFLRLHLPSPLNADSVAELLARLAQPDAPIPLILETRATDDGISYLLGVHPSAAEHLVRLLRDLVPGIRSMATRPSDRAPIEAGGHISTHPPGLPLRVDGAETTIRAIYSAFGARRPGETVVVQVIIGLGHAPRALPTKITDPSASLWKSLSHGTQLAPAEMRSRMKTTAEQANLDVGIRIGASASTPERRKRLVVELVGAMATAQSPGVRLQLGREDIQRLNAAVIPSRWPIRLSVAELLPLIAWPIGDQELPGLPAHHPRLVPVPASLSTTENVFATANAPGDSRLVGIRTPGRMQHLVVTGPTGSGKSMVFASLIAQDIAAGRPLVLVDPKRQLVDFISERVPVDLAERVVIIDAADVNPVGFNPLDTDGRNKDVVVDGILSAFKAVFEDGWGPRTEDLMHAGLLSLAIAGEVRGAPYTLLDLPRLLTDSPFRREVIGAISGDQTLASFWAVFEELSPGARAQIIAAPMNKLRKFVLRKNLAAVLGQPRPRFRLRDIFLGGKAVLVPLNDSLLGPGAAQLLGSLVVAELWMATLERAAEARPLDRPAAIYIDEVQQFLHLPTSIADALATSRSYGVSWNLAHQFRDQLPAQMRAAFDTNARNKVVFGLGPDDARDLARMATRLVAEDFMALKPYDVYANVVDDGAPAGWFSARTLAPTAALHDGDIVRQKSRDQWGQVERPDTVDTPELGDALSEPAPVASRKARRS
ncbi:type IV secretory system conjugative DNA transfer family protein [Cryobacterium lyxosi]|uniref:Type IV secretory system conjugative DNA transfer family protein n=1 Tax=Cryobacterium lyxosi TaxID=1259228 RepID=A0A4R8ZHF0_9MICO|nr:type IV secretory system conjugative DNA transfer family protein [Cryobacterium lyxosi]TFD27340.1 type IV secretory system conjugative DNA transfer family protein [Cryobacterium lyxosi]